MSARDVRQQAKVLVRAWEGGAFEPGAMLREESLPMTITVQEIEDVILRAVEGGAFDELFEIPKTEDGWQDAGNPARCRRAAEIAEAICGTPPGVIISAWFSSGGPKGFWTEFHKRKTRL